MENRGAEAVEKVGERFSGVFDVVVLADVGRVQMEDGLLADSELGLEELGVLRESVDLAVNGGNGGNELGFDLGVEEVVEIVAPAIEKSLDAELIDDLRVKWKDKTNGARLLGVHVLRVDHFLLRLRGSSDEERRAIRLRIAGTIHELL